MESIPAGLGGGGLHRVETHEGEEDTKAVHNGVGPAIEDAEVAVKLLVVALVRGGRQENAPVLSRIITTGEKMNASKMQWARAQASFEYMAVSTMGLVQLRDQAFWSPPPLSKKDISGGKLKTENTEST